MADDPWAVEGKGPWLTYPGDDGSEPPDVRARKAQAYADHVYSSADAAAREARAACVPLYREWSRQAGVFGRALNVLTLGGWSYWRMVQIGEQRKREWARS